jgi:hypothetical protein
MLQLVLYLLGLLTLALTLYHYSLDPVNKRRLVAQTWRSPFYCNGTRPRQVELREYGQRYWDERVYYDNGQGHCRSIRQARKTIKWLRAYGYQRVA